MGRYKRSRLGGFTLVEFLVVLALAVTVQAIAAPAMSKWTDSFRLTTSTNTLLSSLQLARSEAIKRNSRVVVCRSVTGLECASSGGWQDGWIVFHDTNNNANLDTGEERLLWESASAERLRLTGNSPVAHYVSYTGMGVARFTSGAFQAGTFTVCSPSAGLVEARQLVLSSTGRVRTSKLTVDHCG